ncbi:uncharacterized protein C8Q71DRAFT_852202 [Rhodofomes roseus]|uniref:DUF6697 domain-containing protein n=1 Tax=Rhodofomes roseus TaxID=34475 RepID=A0ABQ8KWK3_9APHY|nr:uncharacterized protein C8Q71DRAFT_852202 [Rhodofomes roseus]KAH9843677.1 hypothetical protein C8Q71DRAFT_852202 [Rhodofomes roseus]
MLNPKVEDIASLVDLTANGDNRPRVSRKKEEPEPLDDALFRSRIKGRSCELIDFVLIPTYEDSVRPRASRAAEERVRNASSTDSKEGAVPGVGVKAEPIDDSRLLPEVGPADSHRNLSEEELREVAQRLKNPTVKIKKDSQFSWKVVTDRMKVVGLGRHPIDLDEVTLNFKFNRHYLHNLYGGSFVATFPRPDPKKRLVHKVDDFMCVVLDLNPHAPINPGDPGLFFSDAPADDLGSFTRTSYRVCVRVQEKPALWRYMGQYRMIVSESLTTDEFAMQPVAVQKTWGQDILLKTWGYEVAARVWYRKRHQQEPPEDEISTLLESKSHMATICNELSWEDIITAFKIGKEVMGIYVMKCVGYDIEFQQILARNYKHFTPPKSKQKPRGDTKAALKRKHRSPDSVTPEPSEDDNIDDADGNDDTTVVVNLVDVGDQLDVEPEVLCVAPKGTRSRAPAKRLKIE